MSASGCCSKWSSQGGFELGDLAVEFADDAHRGAWWWRRRRRRAPRGGQLGGAQRGLDFAGTGLEVALAAGRV